MVSFNLGLKLSGVLICVLCLGMSLRAVDTARSISRALPRSPSIPL